MLLRDAIRQFLGYEIRQETVHYEVVESIIQDGYTCHKITYPSNYDDYGRDISAFLLIPDEAKTCPAVLLQHQHHGQRHLGKSEVIGLAGDPLQNFGEALVKRGMIVLAPDSICFEDRRQHMSGIGIDEELDGLRQFDEMCYRLIQGDTLMHRVLDDASIDLALLEQHPLVDNNKIGTLGHSYGGNRVLFHAAVDERIRWACSSGAVCSYQHKMANNISLGMELAIPGFAAQWDVDELVRCIAPSPFLVVSATEDVYAQDADKVLEKAASAYDGHDTLTHHRYEGGHPITQERFDKILAWVDELLA